MVCLSTTLYALRFFVRCLFFTHWQRNTGDTLVEKCVHFFDLMNRMAPARCFPMRVYASGGQDVNHLPGVGSGLGGDVGDVLDNG